MNAHTPITPQTPVERRLTNLARLQNPPTLTGDQLAAHVASIPFGSNAPADAEPGYWGAKCVERVLYGDQLRPVQVIDPDTDTMGFVLFPMPAERVAGCGR